MGTLETFDHTADVGLRVTGDDLDDLFRTAALGLFGYVVANLDDVRPTDRVTIELAAGSTADLLFAWLGELIFLSETRHAVYGRFLVDVADDGLSLRAEAQGEPMDAGRHGLDHEVKAVTRHGFEVRRLDGSGWAAEMVLDV